jgi:hypothetical protein
MQRKIYLGAVLISLVGQLGCGQILGLDADPMILPPSCSGTVHVRIASDFSGTATDIAIPHFFGIYDHLRYLNEHGGIMGCQIDIATSDNHYTGPGTQMVVDAWRASDPDWSKVNTVFVFGTGPTQTVAPGLTAEQKIIIPGSYSGALASPIAVDKTIEYPTINDQFTEGQVSTEKKSPGYPYVFFPATDYATAIRLAIQSVWQIGPGRMAFAHETVDKCAYCEDPLVAGKSYLKNLQGMELGRDLIIAQTSSPSDAPAIDAAVQSYFQNEISHVIADANYKPVVWVWSGNSVMASSLLGQSLWKVQQSIDANMQIPTAIRSKWKVRVIANNWGIGETTPTICGTACNNDNFYGLFPVPKYGDIDNSAKMNDIIQHHDEFAQKDAVAMPPIPARTSDQYRDVRYVQGYAAALMWEKGMTAAVLAGHRNPTGNDLKEAFEKFNNIDMGGVTSATIGFTAKDHRPQSGESIYKLDSNGQLTFVSRYNIPLVDDWLGW